MNHRETKKTRMNPLIFLAPALIFLAGAGIFLYPAISNILAEHNQENVIHHYRAIVEEKDDEELEREWREAEIYNENLAGDPVHDPFVLGSGYVLPDNYPDVLNISGDGVMGYVDIPKIDVYLSIYHGTSVEAPVIEEEGETIVSSQEEIHKEDVFQKTGAAAGIVVAFLLVFVLFISMFRRGKRNKRR